MKTIGKLFFFLRIDKCKFSKETKMKSIEFDNHRKVAITIMHLISN